MIYYETNYLAHHGVKGQKWGRRKQRISRKDFNRERWSIEKKRTDSLYRKQRGANLESPEVNRRISAESRQYADKYMASKYGQQTLKSMNRRNRASMAVGAAAIMAIPALVVGGSIYKSLK